MDMERTVSVSPKRKKKLCYVILSARSLVWFLLTVIAAMLEMISLFTPHWLVSTTGYEIELGNNTVLRYPSFGLASRCKRMSSGTFECATFSVMSTSTTVFPFFWKLSYIFMLLGFIVISITCLCSFFSFCRQSIVGKSLHNVTGSLQILSGIFVMIAMFLYPIGWESERITYVCNDISPFYTGELCSLGYSFYASTFAVAIAFGCGVLSLKAEKASMNPSIKRRIEEGNERLVFAP